MSTLSLLQRTREDQAQQRSHAGFKPSSLTPDVRLALWGYDAPQGAATTSKSCCSRAAEHAPYEAAVLRACRVHIPGMKAAGKAPQPPSSRPISIRPQQKPPPRRAPRRSKSKSHLSLPLTSLLSPLPSRCTAPGTPAPAGGRGEPVKRNCQVESTRNVHLDRFARASRPSLPAHALHSHSRTAHRAARVCALHSCSQPAALAVALSVFSCLLLRLLS